MKLCSRLFVLHCRSRPKYDRSRHFDPHFEEVRGGVEPWLMARWKACANFLLSVIMVALWNRADHYIFMLWFLLLLLLLLLLLFPRLISAAADWMSAILPHMVWP